ncbi:FAD-dependent oxidoreductase [Candidatus Desantisbacteria bacterium]|nr:FAD-dependent oxidoreductase [Candidatus Desantisbacteria bacterium]
MGEKKIINRYDVIIIGGGVIGVSVARELSHYNLNIALLEKEEELCFGVSKSNSGIIHPGTQNPPYSLKGKLCVQGNLLTRKIAKELDNDIKTLLNIKKDAEAFGVPALKIVSSAWLRENEPNLNAEIVAALYAPTAGIISPYRLVYDMSENAMQNGVEIYTETLVKSINFFSPFSFKIYTSGGEYTTKYIINAAGLFADDISGMAGIFDFKIHPRKGEEFLLDKKKSNLTNHLIFPLPAKKSKGIIVIKTSDGNTMIGPTAEDVEDKNDLSTSDAGLYKNLCHP